MYRGLNAEELAALKQGDRVTFAGLHKLPSGISYAGIHADCTVVTRINGFGEPTFRLLVDSLFVGPATNEFGFGSAFVSEGCIVLAQPDELLIND